MPEPNDGHDFNELDQSLYNQLMAFDLICLTRRRFFFISKQNTKQVSESYYGYMITVTRLGEFGHRRRRRWRVRRSIQIYSDSHWGRINSKVEIIWLRL